MELLSAAVWCAFPPGGIMNNLNKTWLVCVSEDDIRDGNVLVANWEEFLKYISSPYSSSLLFPSFKPVLLSSDCCIDNFRPQIPSYCSPTALCKKKKKSHSDSAVYFFFLISVHDSLVLLLWEYNPFLIKVVCILRTRQAKSCSLEVVICVHVMLPCVSVTDYRDSVCLGGVWSKAVVDVKTEGDLCGCGSFFFIVILVCSEVLSVCSGGFFLHLYSYGDKLIFFCFVAR